MKIGKWFIRFNWPVTFYYRTSYFRGKDNEGIEITNREWVWNWPIHISQRIHPNVVIKETDFSSRIMPNSPRVIGAEDPLEYLIVQKTFTSGKLVIVNNQEDFIKYFGQPEKLTESDNDRAMMIDEAIREKNHIWCVRVPEEEKKDE